MADPLSREPESFLSRRSLPPLPLLEELETGDDGVLGREDVELSLDLVGAPLFCLTGVLCLTGSPTTGLTSSFDFAELVNEFQRESAPPQVEVKLSFGEGEATTGVLVRDAVLVVDAADLELPGLGVEVEKRGDCLGSSELGEGVPVVLGGSCRGEHIKCHITCIYRHVRSSFYVSLSATLSTY